MKGNKLLAVLGIAGLLATHARASLDYLYVNPGFADGSGQIDVRFPTDYSGGVGYNSGMWVGELTMKDPATDQAFTAFCLSPTGLMYPGLAAYNPLTPDAAKYGLNPATWSPSGGIENAVYIWNQNRLTLTNNTGGAALGLAIWAALYNSTAVGNVSLNGPFSVSGAGLTPEMLSLGLSQIAALNAAGQSGVESVYNQHPATILRPVDASMQDLIIPNPAHSSPAPALAPEPSSFFALAALLATTAGKWFCRLKQRGLSPSQTPPRACRRRVCPSG